MSADPAMDAIRAFLANADAMAITVSNNEQTTATTTATSETSEMQTTATTTATSETSEMQTTTATSETSEMQTTTATSEMQTSAAAFSEAHTRCRAELVRLQNPLYRGEVAAARHEEANLLMHSYRRQMREFNRRTQPQPPSSSSSPPRTP